MPRFHAILKKDSTSPPVLIPEVSIDDEGDIRFAVTDEKGALWYIASLKASTGCLVRTGSLPNHLGLSLDAFGRVREQEDFLQ